MADDQSMTSWRDWGYSSAFMKAFRMKREEEALLWGGVLFLLRRGPSTAFRLLRSTGEDCLSFPPQEMAFMLALKGEQATWPELAKCIALGSRSLKWWEPAGHGFAEFVIARNSQHWPVRSLREAEQLMQRGLENCDPLEMMAGWMGATYPDPAGLMTSKANFLGLSRVLVDIGLQQKAGPLVNALSALLPRFVKCGDDTIHANIMYVCCRGPWPAMPSLEPGLTDAEWEAKASIILGEASHPPRVPSWAKDGVHVQGRDPRFAGHPAGMRNMLEMYAKYGRVDPRDPGVSLKALGEGPTLPFRPVIREETRQVLSETVPGVTYTLIRKTSGEESCTCPAFERGYGPCKHLRKAFHG